MRTMSNEGAEVSPASVEPAIPEPHQEIDDDGCEIVKHSISSAIPRVQSRYHDCDVKSSDEDLNPDQFKLVQQSGSPKQAFPRARLSTHGKKAEMRESDIAFPDEGQCTGGFGGSRRKCSAKQAFPRERLSTHGKKAEMRESDSLYSDSDSGSDQIPLPNDVYAHLKTFEDISGAPSEPQSEI